MAKRLTQEEFIQKASEIHDNQYDYGKVEYVNNRTPVTIKCKLHGEFSQTPKLHLLGNGCRECGYLKVSDKKSKSPEQFLKECEKVNKGRYDLSKVVYSGAHEKITLICPNHGEFEMAANDFLKGRGCRECSYEERGKEKQLPYEDFLRRATETHQGRYEYDESSYTKSSDRLRVKCEEHGWFEQIATSHLAGQGCPRCARNVPLATEEFIEQARKVHGDKYDYSITKYDRSHTEIKYKCATHGVVSQSVSNHLQGWGCAKCSPSYKKTTETFIGRAREVHGDKYDYSLVDYKTSTDKVKIICKEHGEFEQVSNYHLGGSNCPKCALKESMQEKELAKFLKQFTKVKRNNRTILGGKELDIVLPEYKIAIEYNGLYWHSTKFLSPSYHLDKTKACEEKGWRLIHIFEDEWTQKKDIVKSRLINILGKTEKRLYARQCNVRQVEASEASKFLEENHIQGKVGSTHKYGLYRKEELVALMTFGGRRVALGAKPKKGEVELLRYCTKKGYSVVGGASKLLKNYILKEKPIEIVTYADRRWSNGDMYKEMGFHFEGETRPNYFYVVGSKREGRYKYRKSELIKQGFPEHLSEREIMEDLELFRIFDCGTYKYKLIPK